MLIWLGKQMLDQKDKLENSGINRYRPEGDRGIRWGAARHRRLNMRHRSVSAGRDW